MTLQSPTHTVTVLRPTTEVDQDPYEPTARDPEETLATGVAATIWFPRGKDSVPIDPDQVLSLRVLVDPIPGVTLQAQDVLEATTGQRYRLTWCEERVGVPGLEHTAGEASQVRRPVPN